MQWPSPALSTPPTQDTNLSLSHKSRVCCSPTPSPTVSPWLPSGPGPPALTWMALLPHSLFLLLRAARGTLKNHACFYPSIPPSPAQTLPRLHFPPGVKAMLLPVACGRRACVWASQLPFRLTPSAPAPKPGSPRAGPALAAPAAMGALPSDGISGAFMP